MRETKTDLSKLSPESLLSNYITCAAVAEGIASLESREHLMRALRDAFNSMILHIDDSISNVDAMKVNLLATALEADLNIEKMQEIADGMVEHFATLLEEKLNAPSQTDRPAAE